MREVARGGCCPPMDLFRSEPMRLVQLIISMESAHCTVSYLGDLGLLQFKDLKVVKKRSMEELRATPSPPPLEPPDTISLAATFPRLVPPPKPPDLIIPNPHVAGSAAPPWEPSELWESSNGGYLSVVSPQPEPPDVVLLATGRRAPLTEGFTALKKERRVTYEGLGQVIDPMGLTQCGDSNWGPEGSGNWVICKFGLFLELMGQAQIHFGKELTMREPNVTHTLPKTEAPLFSAPKTGTPDLSNPLSPHPPPEPPDGSHGKDIMFNLKLLEHDDVCGDEENDVGIHTCLKPIGKESDSFFSNSSFSPKRARIEKTSSLSGILQCSQRIFEAVPNPYTTFYDDYLQDMVQQQKGIKEICVGSIWQTRPHCTIFSKLPKQETDLLQVAKVNDKRLLNELGKTRSIVRAEDEDIGGCELSVTIPLPHPSPQRSNASSSLVRVSSNTSSIFSVRLYRSIIGSRCERL